jgi:hypothetical protein
VTVLTQAKVLAPRAFGSGAPSPKCDLCEKDWTERRQPCATAYGPFTVWCCWPCSVLVAKGNRSVRAG